MFLVYTPEGQDEERWLYQPGRLRTREMKAIERRCGLKYGAEFKQALMQGDTSARQALLWTFLRRTHHTISFDDVDFCDDELKLVMDRDELAAEIAALEEFDGIGDDERAAGLALLRMQLADAPYPPGKDPRTAEEKLAAVRDLVEPPAPPTPPVQDIHRPGPMDPYHGAPMDPYQGWPANPYHGETAPVRRFGPVMAEPAAPADAAGPPTTSSTPAPTPTWPTQPTPAPTPGPEPSRH